MSGSHRIQVTVSREMRVALSLLAARSSIGLATQATAMLRQALDRTIESEACKKLLAAETAYRTAAQWRADQYEEREVDRAVEKVAASAQA
jgi:hypothetical protein